MSQQQKPYGLLQFTTRETATLLAALRYFQRDHFEAAINTHEYFAEVDPLSVEEIDLLCDRINEA